MFNFRNFKKIYEKENKTKIKNKKRFKISNFLEKHLISHFFFFTTQKDTILITPTSFPR